MADVHTLPELTNLKNSKILVSVEEALLDLLVVSFEHDSKLYQGVLLDASKRCLPCGISASSGFPTPQSSASGVEEDKLCSVSQRFSYFQQKSPPHPGVAGKDGLPPGSAYHLRRAMRGGHSKIKNSRMTVRLRPRQVLCSKCKSICNENSENVDFSKKRKGEESPASSDGPLEKRSCPPRQISPKSSRAPFSENPQDNKSSSNPVSTNGRKKSSSPSIGSPSLHPSIIPKNVEEDNSYTSNVGKIKIVGGYWTRQPSDLSKSEPEKSKRPSSSRVKVNGQEESGPSVSPVETVVDGSSLNCSAETSDTDEKPPKNCLKSNSSEVDPLLNTTLDSSDSFDHHADSSKHNSSFVSCETDESQDRMVLRKKRNIGSMEDLWDESVFLEDTTRRTTPVIKISFGTQGEGTVLKIPAKVRNYHGSESDLEDVDGNQSETQTKDASAKAAKRALKRAKKEARRKLVGGASPRSLGGSSPAYESTLYHRRHKRKVKHKKRHKEDRVKHDMGDEVSPLLEEDPLKIEEPHSAVTVSGEESSNDYQSVMKEQCLKQKLSINLKRLTATAYARCGDSGSSAGSNSPGSNSETSGADELPDFPGPPSDHPLVTVDSCRTGDGRTMEVGDVVWGKIHGFPWWPGKVLSITIARREDGASEDPQAHVAWYGSSTSSVMPCDQLDHFLETFETRYNKKKRGPYKEAIRQATCEARKDSHDPLQEVDVVS